jgi:hypothetical protein
MEYKLRRKVSKNGKIEYTLILNDLHSPYFNIAAVLAIILRYRFQIKRIVFGGDIIDCQAISVYPDWIRKSLVKEIIDTYTFLKLVRKLVPDDVDIILVRGNHEKRWKSYIAKSGLAFNELHPSNILRMLVNGFVHYDEENRIETNYPPINNMIIAKKEWWVKIGDAIIAHPDNYSKVPMRTAANAAMFFDSRGIPFNVLVMPHTHHFGEIFEDGKWLIESGCLCNSMGYSEDGNISYKRQEQGYILLAQENGITNYNLSQHVKVEFREDEKEWQKVSDQS